MFSERIHVTTGGRGLVDITDTIAEIVSRSEVRDGVCNAFLQHTSAGLLIQENADPDVLRDLETWLSGAVADGDPRFVHTAEGPDDMSAHLRTMLTQTSLVIPVSDGRLALGTWQGIYLYEHRTRQHTRRLVVTVWP